ncbi:MAG: phosphodiesterase [Gammaproteobacteria bacterium]|jgi:HD-GYP domain-containing protein (c-di-GMP phosphodiesterase class II)|nr:phosphodiesterase [Gammaproteobacteria bacterium]MBU0787852.1 phosphodiesterase [Gammaproteobacteria bacterium]MBU0817030.1 phosphodiesterase [Gammaproteobacteria bacterium]MBU1787194.1 phosphodiesterase [Gammaproteobacteria bacterium]
MLPTTSAPLTVAVQTENDYEDLLSLWSDLESGLGIILSSPNSIQEFEARVQQYDRWMQALLKQDTDVGLYLLFQLASNSSSGYSASHALVCAVLCHLIAVEMKIPVSERDNLVHAALTMNIGMTALQDELALQMEKPSAQQRQAIEGHAAQSREILAAIGVSNNLWLDIVSLHHDDSVDRKDFSRLPIVSRLARTLRMVDRYAAMISPRKSRTGRNAIESARTIITSSLDEKDVVGRALVRAVGLCPPGTFVKLDSSEVAIVMGRSSKPNHPNVAIVTAPDGSPLPQPRLHRTAVTPPRIESALTAAAIRQRLNHHRILQLGAYAAQHR